MTVLSPETEGRSCWPPKPNGSGSSPRSPPPNSSPLDPEPGVLDAGLQWLGLDDADSDDLEGPAAAVETVTDAERRVAGGR